MGADVREDVDGVIVFVVKIGPPEEKDLGRRFIARGIVALGIGDLVVEGDDPSHESHELELHVVLSEQGVYTDR